MKRKIFFILLAAVFAAGIAFAEKLPVAKAFRPEKELYKTFANPDARHRPYVRWWWNGARVNEQEILRELDVMHKAGIGGVEINTIQFPDQTADTVGCAALTWLSDEWIRMVNVAADGCRERGMVCDIIVGSGWPFGAEYLAPEEQVQMLYPVTVDVKGGRFTIGRDEVLGMANAQVANPRSNPTKELLFIRLMPKHVAHFTEGVSYDEQAGNDTITVDVPEGEHVLYFFVKLNGYSRVILGAPGASGPVVNHLDGKAVERYLDKFSDAMHFTRGKLKGEIRAAFCDSFELEGNNWTPGMFAEFEKRMGYSLYPFLPYVFQRTGAMGEPVREAYGCSFSPEVTRDVIERVRHDFWHVQMQLFKENFIDVYNAWCHRNGLKSRIQAYGHQLHPIETSMYLDIPECESWIHDGIGRVMEPNQYLSGRGYSMVNKFVASGAFLANRNIVSCEEQTNVGNIFQTTLEEVKVTGDRSNLSGVNHSVLHGFNYSPRQKDFFGWIQFGTYFNENNTWWPYVRPWMDYKARVSALLQNSVYQADIAILPPLEDLWSIHGMQRDPYPGVTYPAYANDLWEAVQQSGNGCDYVSEKVICQSSVAGGRLRFGSRSYKTLLLMEVESLEPLDRCAHRRLRGSGRTCDRHREGAPQGARLPRCRGEGCPCEGDHRPCRDDLARPFCPCRCPAGGYARLVPHLAGGIRPDPLCENLRPRPFYDDELLQVGRQGYLFRRQLFDRTFHADPARISRRGSCQAGLGLGCRDGRAAYARHAERYAGVVPDACRGEIHRLRERPRRPNAARTCTPQREPHCPQRHLGCQGHAPGG